MTYEPELPALAGAFKAGISNPGPIVRCVAGASLVEAELVPAHALAIDAVCANRSSHIFLSCSKSAIMVEFVVACGTCMAPTPCPDPSAPALAFSCFGSPTFCFFATSST